VVFILKKRIIVIGGGVTGVTAIKAIREFDKESEVFFLCEEKFYPYMRIKLSKNLFDLLNEDKMLLQKKEWYEENNINIFVDVKVIKVDTNICEVFLSNGTSLKYDKLLFANGANNRKPPINGIDKEGVFTLRTLKDTKEIKNTAMDKENILIIGGGIQGLEIAWIMHQHNKKISLCEIQSRLMPIQLDEVASKVLKQAVENVGVSINLNTAVNKIIGLNHVEGVVTTEEKRINCDIVIYSTGTMPNIDIVKDTTIKTTRGIVVNERMETNIENIYAAGDVAEFNGINVGLWNIGIGQGKVAGYNMVNNECKYNHIVPVTTLNAFNISLFSMGIVQDENADVTIVKDESDKSMYNKIFIKNNRIVGAIVIGDIRRSPILKTAIEKETNLFGIDLSKISIDELLDELKNK
jgi:nitrite reductase (NADH) large subunit